MCNKKSVPFLVTETAFAYKYHSSALQVVECCMRALLLLESIIVLDDLPLDRIWYSS